ncbi:uncharacterized protein LOC127120606 isoform X4 [Lathyrus oleraceus]|uniref:uncharacterized protein LOC127120606 isoform X4 n=1 Tax=Pisum sativum TaxID=3888 RepID=UPI0021D3CD7E|nr:uncharacterized protein LOC127120606 isoform X4 [Pisum sativum]
MDYDDSDFESHNLHLAGEGSAKFPPVLRPYALPKFDFDESLQANSRFDSLVETEVFLGIESNEDNQWIDAFSRGGSSIEFNSTAAGSCSISRYGNVWSEATSSESVEMLLKSVGQGEYTPRQTVIQESDACDELSCLAKQMDSNPKPDDRNEFTDNVTDLQLPGDAHISFSGSKKPAGIEQSQTGISQSQEGELSIEGSSGILEPNDMFQNIDLPMSEHSRTFFTNDKFDITNQREAQTVADDSDHCETRDSSALVVETNITDLSIQNMVDEKQNPQLTESNNQNLESSMMKEEAVVDTQTLDQNAVDVDGHHPDRSIFAIPPQDSLEGGSVVKGLDAELSSLEDSMGTRTVAVSDMQKEERCSEDIRSCDLTWAKASENSVSLKDTVMDDQSISDTRTSPMVSVKDDPVSVGQVVEVVEVSNSSYEVCPNLQQTVDDTCTLPMVSVKDDPVSVGQVVEVSNSSYEVCPNLQQTMDLTEKETYSVSNVLKENESSNIGGDHMDTGILSSKSEASMFPAEQNIISSEGNNEIRVGDFSGFSLVTSSTNSSIVSESTQICVNNESDKQSDLDKFGQDVSVNDEENTKIRSDSSQMHSDVAQSHLGDKGVVSSPLSLSSLESELTTSTVSIDAKPVNISASQVISENISLTSCERMNDPPPSESVSIHGPTGDNDIQRVTTVESSSAEVKEENAMKITEETGISALVGSSEQETTPYPPVKEIEKLHPPGTSGHLISHSMLDVGTHGAAILGELQRTVDEKVTQECTKEFSVPPVLCESLETQSAGVTISVINDDKEILQETHDKSSPKELGDVLLGNKDSISSPLPDSRVELPETGSFLASSICSPSNTFRSPSQTEKEENQGKASASTFRSLSQTEKEDNQGKASANQNRAESVLKNSGTHNTLSAAQVQKRDTVSKDERSSSPEINVVVNLSKKDTADLDTDVSKRQSALVITTNNASIALAESPSTSGLGSSKTKTVANVSHGSPQISDGEVALSASKATPKRKARQSSNKAAGKESARRGGRVKNASPVIQSEKGDISTKVSHGPSPGFKLMHSTEVQQYGHTDSNSAKAFSLVNTSTSSSLPDLNTSASSPVLFHQPFTDLQQVQLRAQIFVYGALIQGTTPEEAHMISAYGVTDGGRNIWENVWRACMERQHSQKSHHVTPETPLQSRSVARTPDMTVKQSELQGKVTSSLLGRASSKATATIANPLMPLSSPLWSLPTLSCDSLQSTALARGSVVDYSQALTPLHPYQSPPPRNFLGHSTSWISQAPLRGPWIGSPTPAPDNSTHLSASPTSDTVKLGSVKGSSLPPSSSITNVTPGPPASSARLQSIFVGTPSQLDANNVTVPPAQHSSDPKPKKRKKAVPSEDLGQKALQSLTPVVGSRASTSVAVATPVGNVPISSVEKSLVSVSPLADQPKNDPSVEKRILSDEFLLKVKEARVHAEEASADSAAAVNHSLELWNQLDKHKSSGFMSDIEAKLASAAVAVAAAAAVAKAAAAAANVASNAAFQAKLMADEALISSGCENSSQSNKVFLSESTSNLGQATPASILKGANGPNSPGSFIGAAKEAIRRRVEAASAATKRAENMDAILKAAELAAEAVSQAGKIVTMGDPLPLIELIEAGPEGCWKASQESSREVGLLKEMTRDLVNSDIVRDVPETSHEQNRDISSSGISSSIMINENNSRGQKARNVSDLVKPVDMVPGSEPEIQAPSLTIRNESENLEETSFKEGSLVEVFKDEEGYKAAWFIANILSLKDGKAYICYTSLAAVEVAGPLKEWVSLECEGDKPPRIRTARPLTSLQPEGTRKRRRAAMGDYAWSVGDRVDAWIQESYVISWREGVITEKNKKDETTLTVHIPASGETLVLRAWHLRPSLIWKDGQWLEFSKMAANSTQKGDTPHEKRPKLGSSNAVDVKGKEKMSKNVDVAESTNPDDLELLNLTENEKIFNIGKNTRSAFQKEESKVTFGVPKPGKKRKFMEVSKHYVAHGSSRNDSAKDANSSIPQGSELRGWRNSSKSDTKEKLGADSKPKTKFGKPQGALGRVIPPRNPSASNTKLTKDSSNHLKGASQSESQAERAPSTTDGATQVPIVFSSLPTSTDTLRTKRTLTSRANKGKLALAGDKLRKGGGEKASIDKPTKSTSESDVHEPRRSNRRIQPTSRLLEGLQSSLIASKIPSISHNRNIPKGNNHQG